MEQQKNHIGRGAKVLIPNGVYLTVSGHPLHTKRVDIQAVQIIMTIVESLLDIVNTWLRFLIKQPDPNPLKEKPYIWQKIKIFTFWEESSGNIVFCFDAPAPFKQRLEGAVSRNHTALCEAIDPYLIHTVITEEVISLFNQSVWSFRDMVREAEQNRNWSSHPQPPFSYLHDVARHIIHSCETLAIAGTTIHAVLNQHAVFMQDHIGMNDSERPEFRKVQQTLEYQQTLLQSLKLRSDALGDRLRNEINLAFNTVSQANSQASVDISKAAQSDSRAMRTIAILTLLFLPGTFISTLLAMPFFSLSTNAATGSEKLELSNTFWIYWAVTAPITAVTMISWLVWQFWETRIWRK